MHKIGKWKIILIVLTLFIIGLFFINHLLEHKLTSKLSALDGVEIEEIDCSVFQNTIDLVAIDLDMPELFGLRGEVDLIQIAGINRLKYFSSGDLIVPEIVIEGGNLYLDLSTNSDSTKGDTVARPNFQIDDFVFRNGHLHILSDDAEVAIVRDISFRIQDLNYHSDSSFSWKDYFIQTGKINLKHQSSAHELEIERTSYNPGNQLAELSGLRYFTQIPSDQWYATVKKKQSRFDFTAQKIELNQPDLLAWVKHQRIEIGKLVVSSAELEVFEDKRFEHCNTCKVVFPHQSLLGMKNGVNIDSVQIKNSRIVYLSREKNKVKPGRLEFSQLYTSIYHLSNMQHVIEAYSHLKVDVQAMIFDSTPLVVHFDFDLLHPQGAYSYMGELGGFDMVRLNDFLSPVNQVVIESGGSLLSSFQAHGNRLRTTGDMLFPYQNMKVEFLSKNKNSKRFMSGLINNLAIKRNNVAGDRFRIGIIYHERDRSRSIFHSLSQSLQSGIKSTVLSKHLLPMELKGKKDK